MALSRAMSTVSLVLVVTEAVFADVVAALAISSIFEPVLLLLPLSVPGRAFRAPPRLRRRTRIITTLARGRVPVPCGVAAGPRSGVVGIVFLPPTNDFEKDGFILITRVGKLVCVPILELPVDGRFYLIS